MCNQDDHVYYEEDSLIFVMVNQGIYAKELS